MNRFLKSLTKSVYCMAIILGCFNVAWADVVIKDANGMVRSEAIGEGNAIVEVKIEPADPKMPSLAAPKVLLKEESGKGKALKQEADAGYVRFDQVPSGVYKIGTTLPGFVFTDIIITYPRSSHMGMAVSAGGAAVGAGLLGVAGVTAGTIAIVNHNRSGSGDKKPLSPHS